MPASVHIPRRQCAFVRRAHGEYALCVRLPCVFSLLRGAFPQPDALPLPFGLLLTVSGGIRVLPLSPSLEMFLLLLILEILIEASVRMPKYVALALSVIGALVLGDTAVKAGLVSSSAIIIVALSGISAYTVPDLTGTLSVVRIAYLLVAGSIGTYGIILLTALILYYLVTSDSYGTPLLAPFSPLIRHDLRDSVFKAEIYALSERPAVFRPRNKHRLKVENRT